MTNNWLMTNSRESQANTNVCYSNNEVKTIEIVFKKVIQMKDIRICFTIKSK